MAEFEAQGGEFSLGLGDVYNIVRRRFWWFAVPSFLVAIVALAVALVWPAEYEAASIVVVESQAVPEALVQTTVVADTEARYGQIKLMLLSRDNLSAIIDEFDLFADKARPIEERVEMMRENSSIEPLPPAIVDPRKPIQIDSFRIAYRGSSPQTVADVANRLTRDFLATNLRERANQAESTSEFIGAELVKTEEERARVAQELMEYREQHQGELPEDLSLNNQRLDRLQHSHQQALSQMETARTQVSEIKRQIHELRTMGTDESSNPVARKKAVELALNRLRSEGKTEKHPDVVIARTELENLEALLAKAYESEAPLSPVEGTLRNEMRGHEVGMTVLERELTRIENEVSEIEARIAATPQRAAQVSQLQATFVGLTDAIKVLSAKRMAADMGRSVELVQKGERFRVIESAVPPTSPVFPNRPLFFVVGAVLGVGLGLLLLVVREVVDQSFHTPHDLQRTLNLPVLGSIPVIWLPAELARARARLRRFAIAGVVIVSLIAGGGLVICLLRSASAPEASAGLAPAAEASHADV